MACASTEPRPAGNIWSAQVLAHLARRRRCAVSLTTVAAGAGDVLPAATTAASRDGNLTVVLTSVGTYDAEEFDAALGALRTRIALLRKNGILEVDGVSVRRRGHDVVVHMTGVADASAAQDLVVPAGLSLRPVLADLPPPASLVVDDDATRRAIVSCDASAIIRLAELPTTQATAEQPDDCVVLPIRKSKARLLLGPSALVGTDVDSAKTNLASGVGFVIDVRLKPEGLAKFNVLAATSYRQTPPQNQVAIVLDGVVQSNPAFQAPQFKGVVQISGGFSSSEAVDLANIINYGTFPMKLKSVTAA